MIFIPKRKEYQLSSTHNLSIKESDSDNLRVSNFFYLCINSLYRRSVLENIYIYLYKCHRRVIESHKKTSLLRIPINCYFNVRLESDACRLIQAIS